MSVLLVNMSIDPETGGGTANRTMEVAKSIQKKGVECIVLSTNKGLPDGYPSLASGPEVVLLRCLNERFYIPYFSWKRLRRIVEEVDMVHMMSHWSLINVVVYFLAKETGKPYSICPAGALQIFGRSAFLKRFYNLIIGNRIIRNASVCMAITDLETNDFHEYGVSNDSITIVPNGIDCEELCPNTALGEVFREKYGLREIPFLLFMGRLNQIKGPDLLLGAFIRIALDFPELHLVFAGPDEGLGSALRETIVKSGLSKRVHVIGYVEGEEKVGAYTAADLLVVPSRREAMSIVALEAGACGTPVLLTDRCGFDEVREAGCEVVAPSVNELAEGLVRTLSSPQDLKQAGKDLRQLVISRYSWNGTAEKYLSLIKS